MIYLKLYAARAVAATFALLAAACHAQSLGYPIKPIRWIVAFPPGGAADVVARTMAPVVSEVLGERVVVDNRGGANGNIGADIVAKATPDGYTLLMGFPGLATNPSLLVKMPYDPLRDLSAVTLLAVTPAVLVVHPGVPASTVQELITLARAQPGKLNYASAGQGAAGHTAGEMFKMLANVNLTHVPYKGGGPALVDLMGGQVQLLFDSIPTSLPLVRSGKLRALAVAGSARSDQMPEVPTFEESGLPGFDAGTWFGVLVPAGTPQPIIDKLHAAFVKSVAYSDTAARFKTLGLNTVAGTPAGFTAFLKEQTAQWAKVIKAAGIRIE